MNDMKPGEYKTVIMDTSRVDAGGFYLRKHELAIRDLFSIQTPDQTYVGFLCRKELDGMSSTECFLRHDTAFMDIDSSRISTSESLRGGAYSEGGRKNPQTGDLRSGKALGMFQKGSKPNKEFEQPPGRWPTNLILVHGSKCEKTGTKKADSGEMREASGEAKPFDDSRGWNTHSMDAEGQNAPKTYGEEKIEDWDCQPSCPVRSIDLQSFRMGIHGAGHKRNHIHNDSYDANTYDLSGERQMDRYGDDGGASRFFYQTTSLDEVINYLEGMTGQEVEVKI